MTIKDIIIEYSQKLEHISDTPRLDVEILLEKALARRATTPNFAISDGWKLIGPKESHLVAPLTVFPNNSTQINNPTITQAIGIASLSIIL